MFAGKTNHLQVSVTPDQENLDIDVLTSDLVNLLRVVFPDPQAAPSILVSRLSSFNPFIPIFFSATWPLVGFLRGFC